jgi:hypothetical protein
MKSLILILCLLISTLSFAETREVLCQVTPGNSMGAFSLKLDNSHFQPNSGYFAITKATWGFAYSGTGAMNCSEGSIDVNGIENFKCVGYANGDWRMEISVKLNKGTGTAKVHNLDDNIYAEMTEGMVLPCRTKVVKK